MKGWYKALEDIVWLTQLGLNMLLPLVLCLAGCWWAVERWNWPEWLFLPGLLAGAAGMAGASLGRRLHPKRLRALYFGCALLVGTGTLLAGAAPALLCAAGPVLVQGALSVWFLHSMQRLNDAIPSDRRATLISVDSMAYSLLMIPASPLVGLVGDLTDQAGAGLCVLGALVAVSSLAAAHKTRYNGRGA